MLKYVRDSVVFIIADVPIFTCVTVSIGAFVAFIALTIVGAIQ